MAEAQPQHATASLPEFNVVLFNVHSNDKVAAADRQACLGVVLDSVLSEVGPSDPLFLLCQESINGKKNKIVCDKLGLQPVRRQTEAMVYCRPDPQHVEFRYVDVGTLRKTDDQMGLEAGVPFEVARLMACVLTSGGAEEKKKRTLLISWHGPETKARKNVDLKLACFRRLVRFSERLRAKEACDIVIIGGDFNLPADKAREVMDTFRRTDKIIDGAVLAEYTRPADRKTRPVIDYIVYWPQDQLHNLHTSVIRPDYRRENGSRPFDHPIIRYQFGNKAASQTVAKELPKPVSKQPEE
ncbi:uncharacterized protein LOC143284006 isoform X2 [Babylonia areolata]|uniref:uncharacterized protein LOC143284006 isoform X2 n=1 Tax=Babylonia areolata TaxID=304850 RepID=UPI003FD46418